MGAIMVVKEKGGTNMKRICMLMLAALLLIGCQPTPEEEYVVNKRDGDLEQKLSGLFRFDIFELHYVLDSLLKGCDKSKRDVIRNVTQKKECSSTNDYAISFFCNFKDNRAQEVQIPVAVFGISCKESGLSFIVFDEFLFWQTFCDNPPFNFVLVKECVPQPAGNKHSDFVTKGAGLSCKCDYCHRLHLR